MMYLLITKTQLLQKEKKRYAIVISIENPHQNQVHFYLRKLFFFFISQVFGIFYYFYRLCLFFILLDLVNRFHFYGKVGTSNPKKRLGNSISTKRQHFDTIILDCLPLDVYVITPFYSEEKTNLGHTAGSMSLQSLAASTPYTHPEQTHWHVSYPFVLLAFSIL